MFRAQRGESAVWRLSPSQVLSASICSLPFVSVCAPVVCCMFAMWFGFACVLQFTRNTQNDNSNNKRLFECHTLTSANANWPQKSSGWFCVLFYVKCTSCVRLHNKATIWLLVAQRLQRLQQIQSSTIYLRAQRQQLRRCRRRRAVCRAAQQLTTPICQLIINAGEHWSSVGQRRTRRAYDDGDDDKKKVSTLAHSGTSRSQDHTKRSAVAPAQVNKAAANTMACRGQSNLSCVTESERVMCECVA